MNISLPTGKVISVSYYEWLFLLKDEDIHEFYQSCIADDLGTMIENPFSNRAMEKLEIDEDTEQNNVQNYFENNLE